MGSGGVRVMARRMRRNDLPFHLGGVKAAGKEVGARPPLTAESPVREMWNTITSLEE